MIGRTLGHYEIVEKLGEELLFVDFEQQLLRLAAVENSAVDRAGGDHDHEVLERAKNDVISGLRWRLPYLEVSFEIDHR